ncbi:hypothetical protein CBR_g32302 [Chara braunii]|uniref:CCHC-type domain-containing protein n=1 Tax=Chara braunii TaxID=69332 RepID=A0A388JN93_CHABU|nr:hypothetical protein CBR_g32302 [Chara braunii]|eukprot:GBG59289.1 hypothetical protein CBR_g32302 [Chara braunii]
MAEGGLRGGYGNCYNCGNYGHHARWCPHPPRNDGYGAGQRQDAAYIQGQPIFNSAHVPSAPPLPSALSLPSAPPLPLPAPYPAPLQGSQPAILQAPTSAVPSTSAPSTSNAIVPYQPPRDNFGGNNARGWNRPRDMGSDSEAMMILREIWNDRREERERRREEKDRRNKEEQTRIAREEEEKRLDAEEKKEAEREARMAKLVTDQMEEIEANKKGASGDVSKAGWDKIERDVKSPKEGETVKSSECEDRKRDQVAMGGESVAFQQQAIGRQRVGNEVTSLDTGLLHMDLDSVRKVQESHALLFQEMMSCLGFDRINRGKKVVVAGSGKAGKVKYIDDLIEVLMQKTKHELKDLCKKDRIKYVNKKIITAALVRLRAIEAYGDEEEEDQSEEESQEENPS